MFASFIIATIIIVKAFIGVNGMISCRKFQHHHDDNKPVKKVSRDT